MRRGRARDGFCLLALFSLWNGDGMRDLLSWWGFGAVSLSLLAVSVITLIRERRRAVRMLRSWQAAPILAFMALCLVSVSWSEYPAATLLGCFVQIATATIAVGLLLLEPPRRLAGLFALMIHADLLLSLLFEAAVALSPAGRILPLWTDYSANVPGAYYWSSGLLFQGGRIQGFTGNANLLCFQGLLGLITIGCLFAAQRTSARLAVAVPAALLDVLIIALTRSATVVIALCTVAAATLVVLGLRRFGRRGQTGLAVGSLALIAAIALSSSRVSEPVLRLLGKGDDFTGRLEIWRLVGTLVGQRPVLGWGWIGYWAPWVYPFDGLVIRDGVQYLQAHNAYLDVQMQLGVPGLLALVAVIGSVVWRALRLALRPGPLSVLPLLLLAALLTQALAESRLLIEGNWAMLVALSVLLPAVDRPRIAEISPGSGGRRVAAAR